MNVDVTEICELVPENGCVHKLGRIDAMPNAIRVSRGKYEL